MARLNGFCELLNRMCRSAPLDKVEMVEGLLSWPGEKEDCLLAEKVLEALRQRPFTQRVRSIGHGYAVFGRAIDLFKEYFGDHALGHLRITISPSNPFQPHCTVEAPQAIGAANNKQWLAHELWDLVFREKGYERIKRCRRCNKWFAAPGRNKIAIHCSDSCRNLWWNRPRRKKAGDKPTPKRAKKQR